MLNDSSSGPFGPRFSKGEWYFFLSNLLDDIRTEYFTGCGVFQVL
jgi:hypothetical protein